MRFSEFILSEGRGKSLDLDKCKDLLSKYCKKSYNYYITKNRAILRGVDSIYGDYAMIDPQSSSRKSANTWNYYTLMLDNDPRWKSYPKRSRSIICTTNFHKAKQYGHIYYVFPYDGSDIGVCPNDDIWDSFSYSTGNMTLGQMNRELRELFEDYSISSDDNNYNTFMKSLDKLSDVLEGGSGLGKKSFSNYDMLERWDFQGRFKDWYLKLFDPKANNFILTKEVSKVFTSGNANKEVWTDGKSIMISNIIDIKGVIGSL